MNIFVTGGTGVLGRVVVRLLLDGGHHVRALARNSDSHSRLRAAGAEPVQASLFDPSTLRVVLQGCDAILHLATRIPPPKDASRRDAWRENDKIRAEGTRNLVNIALESEVATLIYPSVVFVYLDGGAQWMDAGTAVKPAAILESSLQAEAEVERFSRAGRRGIVLRMGSFYGPTAGTTRSMLRMARHGVAMIFGASNSYQPLIWVDDAAVAVFDALGKAPPGIYDIVDDEPLQRRELASVLAQAAGRRWLFRPPVWLFWILAGKNVMFLTRSQRVSNQQFKKATGWYPMVPNARDGFRLLVIEP
ncbi:MAG TPA: NAD(P)-dependent oxidoreductase [Terriglobia bacterium]